MWEEFIVPTRKAQSLGDGMPDSICGDRENAGKITGWEVCGGGFGFKLVGFKLFKNIQTESSALLGSPWADWIFFFNIFTRV